MPSKILSTKATRLAVYAVTGIVGGVSIALGIAAPDDVTNWFIGIPGVLSVISGTVAAAHITPTPEVDTSAVDSLESLRDTMGGE